MKEVARSTASHTPVQTRASHMHVRHIRLIAATLLLCSMSFSARGASPSEQQPASQLASLTGAWQLSVESAMGKRTPSVVLQQNGNALTGTYTGQFGSAPVTGSVNGHEFTFTFKVSAMMREAVITYVGKAEGNAISGKVQAGGMGEGAFSGVRK